MTKRVLIAGEEPTETLIILRLLLRDYHPRDFTVCLWDGSQWPAEANSPRFKLVFNHPDVLRRMLRDTKTDLAISEAYIRGNLDVEGDLEAAMPVAYHLMSRRWPLST